MAAGSSKKATQNARERARLYEARQRLHRHRIVRRRRDNLVAGIVGGLLLVGILGAQTASLTLGPDTPSPEPTSTVTPAPSPTP